MLPFLPKRPSHSYLLSFLQPGTILLHNILPLSPPGTPIGLSIGRYQQHDLLHPLLLLYKQHSTQVSHYRNTHSTLAYDPTSLLKCPHLQTSATYENLHDIPSSTHFMINSYFIVLAISNYWTTYTLSLIKKTCTVLDRG